MRIPKKQIARSPIPFIHFPLVPFIELYFQSFHNNTKRTTIDFYFIHIIGCYMSQVINKVWGTKQRKMEYQSKLQSIVKLYNHNLSLLSYYMFKYSFF